MNGRDFTHSIYKELLLAFKEAKYNFVTVDDYFKKDIDRPLIILRHDVDRYPNRSLQMATLEYNLGIKATYYFRTIPSTFKPNIIKKIANMGHEIGYHYESLAQTNGDYKKAIEDFEFNLKRLREIADIKNIAMHGRPTSKWDSRWLWREYDYKEFNIVSEPYFDIDFNRVFYATDAGRAWGDEGINLRDRVDSTFNINIKHTQDLINALKNSSLPNEIMLNIHPEHWAKNLIEWYQIYLIRSIKNRIKRVLLKRDKLRNNETILK